MSREDTRIKLLRMVQGQVKSYIADHPDHFAPYALDTAPKSIAKRIAHELIAKGLTFDPKLISTLKQADFRRAARSDRQPPRPFEVAYKRRRSQ
jgi:hypothetical protein